jgi:hypothetical protein
MTRISDFTPPLNWPRPASSPARAADAKDASSWFDVDGLGTDVTISGDVSLAARGLGVEQHASRVLAHLRGDPDASL